MTRRRALALSGGLLVIAAAAAGATVVIGQSDDSDASDADETAIPPATAEVERRDLIQREDVAGRLSYGGSRPISGAGIGTITGLPDVGDVLDHGRPAWEIDGHAGPILMRGDRPMWRDLSTSSDDGPDVHQLEQNLVDLGFADPDELTVDDEFTWVTKEAVRDLQEAFGLEETGEIELGEIIFTPGPVRVTEVTGTLGTNDSGAVLSVTGTEQMVSVDLDVGLVDLVAEDDKVTVTMPGGKKVKGTVTSLGKVAKKSGDGQNDGGSGGDTPTVSVSITLDGDHHGLDEAPVGVSLVTSRATGVLAVPVSALLALAEGGHAVEVPDGQTTRLVPVEIGEFADGWAEVSGDLQPGDAVVVPR